MLASGIALPLCNAASRLLAVLTRSYLPPKVENRNWTALPITQQSKTTFSTAFYTISLGSQRVLYCTLRLLCDAPVYCELTPLFAPNVGAVRLVAFLLKKKKMIGFIIQHEQCANLVTSHAGRCTATVRVHVPVYATDSRHICWHVFQEAAASQPCLRARHL